MPIPDFLSTILIAIGLSMDCFAVSLGGSCSLKKLSPVGVFRAALAFGFSQTLMALLGWLGGQTLVQFVGAYDHWVAFGLLAFIGGKMVREAFHGEEEHRESDITRGWLLLTLSVATSIDSLAVGLSFAFLQVEIIQASLIIGLVACIVTIAGFLLGRKVGEIAGRRAEAVGGIILIGIGIRIVITHLFT